MCTAVTYKTKNFYFGRNFDLNFSYGESVTITPRNYPLKFRNGNTFDSHYAIIGIAFVCENYPLYYDAVNEKGLCIAGLNFPDNAVYGKKRSDYDNIASFEFIPMLLGACSDVAQAKQLLEKIHITDEDFSDNLPRTPLHWIIADKREAITVEPLKYGLTVTDNPVGVLTNSPVFDFHMHNLSNYLGISPSQPKNIFCDKIRLPLYSLGMGTIGLPGDLSSQSRFVRAAFTKLCSVSENDELSSVSQFFHILDSVIQPKGCNDIGGNIFEYTVYSSCCNAEKGIYYHTTYENRSITAHNMYDENLNSAVLTSYPLNRLRSPKF